MTTFNPCYVTMCTYEAIVDIVMKLLRLVCCRWKWQAFSLDLFTCAYCPDNSKRIVDSRSDNILLRDVIQPHANRENYDTEIFDQARNEDNTKCTI